MTKLRLDRTNISKYAFKRIIGICVPIYITRQL